MGLSIGNRTGTQSVRKRRSETRNKLKSKTNLGPARVLRKPGRKVNQEVGCVSKTLKIILASVVVLLITAGVAWKVAAPRVLAGVQGLLLSQVNSSINGRVDMGTIDFSALGSAVLKKVTLFDKAGLQVAASDEISVSYTFNDLVKGNFGIESVKTITVEGLTMKLGIDKTGRWSLQDIIKAQVDRPSVFQGRIVLKNAVVSVTTPNWKREFTAISGEMDYATHPVVKVDLAGKTGKSSIAAQGTWIPDGKTQLAIKIDTMDLIEAQALLPSVAGNPKLSSGMLKDVKGTVIQEKSGVQMTGEALLSGMVMNLQGLSLKEGNAKLTMQGKKVMLQDGSVTVDGNKLSVAGSIDFSPISPLLALKISSPGVNMASLSVQKASLTGSVAVQADIGGTIDKPVAKGTFKLISGAFDSNAIADAEGFFSYTGDILTLDNANAKALGGSIGITGSVMPKTSRYNLKVSGQNVDGAVLTNQGLTGRMDFNATIAGDGGPEAMSASGVFTLPSGKISDYAVANVSGSFRKQGNRVDLSNVGMTLSGQRISANGVITLASGSASPQMNLNISSGGINATVFNPNSALKGMIAFQATVTGTPAKNQARGNFQIASGSLGQLPFSGASGGFGYVDGVLTLAGGRAQCLGGTITLNGTVVPKTMEYRQQVNGQNIDAAQLTDRDVQGRADFAATISGMGDWDKANGNGNFKMNAGNVKGIPFNGLTGNFSKRGRQTEFTNMKFNMLGGLASGTGETEGEYVHLIITPNATTNTALSILTGKTLQSQDLRVRFRGPNG